MNSIEGYTEIVNTSNPILSSLLSVKFNAAKLNNIDINFDIIDVDGIQIEFIDLTIVIGNILDNAITACEKVEGSDKCISLNMFNRNKNFCIHMRNSKKIGLIYDNKKRFTTKINKDDHGYGLSNVRHVVGKYNGVLKMEDKGEEFDLKIYFPIKS